MPFNALYNRDGSLSWFRLICLLVIAACMLLYALTLLRQGTLLDGLWGAEAETPKAGQEKDPETVESGESAKDKGADGQERPDAAAKAHQARQELMAATRAAAFSELVSSAKFYQDCGAVNKGYVGCHYAYPDELTSAYQIEDGATDDGFFITFRAKAAQAEDKCPIISYTSSGDLRVMNHQGAAVEGCVPPQAQADIQSLAKGQAPARDQSALTGYGETDRLTVWQRD